MPKKKVSPTVTEANIESDKAPEKIEEDQESNIQMKKVEVTKKLSGILGSMNIVKDDKAAAPPVTRDKTVRRDDRSFFLNNPVKVIMKAMRISNFVA